MTALPRSLNDPVGICNSSLNSTAAPSQRRSTSGVHPSPSETCRRIAQSQGSAVAPQRSLARGDFATDQPAPRRQVQMAAAIAAPQRPVRRYPGRACRALVDSRDAHIDTPRIDTPGAVPRAENAPLLNPARRNPVDPLGRYRRRLSWLGQRSRPSTTRSANGPRSAAAARRPSARHTARGTGKGGTGIIRIEFPDAPNSKHDALEEISWEEFFEKFDESDLALVYQEETAGGEKSNFNKLIGRETAEAREHGVNHASRHHPKGR